MASIRATYPAALLRSRTGTDTPEKPTGPGARRGGRRQLQRWEEVEVLLMHLEQRRGAVLDTETEAEVEVEAEAVAC
jgi:hypothetical protein